MKRKAQISNFVMIGIILVLATGLFLFLKYKVLLSGPQEIVPPEYEPIKDFVELCMKEQAKEAIIMLGQQGGFVELPNRIGNNPFAYIEFIKGGLFRVPLWYYMGESRIPSPGTIENQIEIYIQQNLETCLQNFTNFQNDFIITNTTLDVKAALADKDVMVSAFFPLTVTSRTDNQVGKITLFSTKLDVKLRKLYELAEAIMEEENRGMFIENTTIDLMVLEPNIPTTDLLLKCGRLTWYKSDVIDELKESLFYNLPRIRIANTDYEPFRDEEQYGKSKFVWDVTKKKYPDVSVGLRYEQEWPLTMRVRPSDGNVMKSNYGKGMSAYLHFLCINLFHFTYDVTYPVEVTLREPTSFGGEGYTFRFGFPVYIDHNEGMRDDFARTDFGIPDIGGDFCEETTERTFFVRAVDSRTSLDLKDVNISLECIRHLCNLGKTSYDGLYYRLQTPLLKVCPIGMITAEHPDYLPAEQIADYRTADQEIVLQMRPLKEFEYTVVKHYSSDPRWPIGLGKNQYAVIAIEDAENDFAVFDNYPKHYAIFEKNMTLIKDTEDYKLEIMLMEDDKYIGGYKGIWNTSYEELADNTHLTFHVIEYSPQPTTDEETGAMIAYLEDQASYPESTRPSFSIGFE